MTADARRPETRTQTQARAAHSFSRSPPQLRLRGGASDGAGPSKHRFSRSPPPAPASPGFPPPPPPNHRFRTPGARCGPLRPIRLGTARSAAPPLEPRLWAGRPLYDRSIRIGCGFCTAPRYQGGTTDFGQPDGRRALCRPRFSILESGCWRDGTSRPIIDRINICARLRKTSDFTPHREVRRARVDRDRPAAGLRLRAGPAERAERRQQVTALSARAETP